jgi:hypothetical protein
VRKRVVFEDRLLFLQRHFQNTSVVVVVVAVVVVVVALQAAIRILGEQKLIV